ncbi:MAG: tetratricopeptide repeat protein [Candidatus Omnitrophota bacterium]
MKKFMTIFFILLLIVIMGLPLYAQQDSLVPEQEGLEGEEMEYAGPQTQEDLNFEIVYEAPNDSLEETTDPVVIEEVKRLNVSPANIGAKNREEFKEIEQLAQPAQEANPLSPDNAIYQKKAEQLEKKVTSLSQELGVAYHTLGQIYTQKKMYAEAIEAYDKSIQYNPDNALVYYHAGLLYAYMGDSTEKAIELLKRYLAMDPHAQYKQKANKLIKLLED